MGTMNSWVNWSLTGQAGDRNLARGFLLRRANHYTTKVEITENSMRRKGAEEERCKNSNKLEGGEIMEGKGRGRDKGVLRGGERKVWREELRKQWKKEQKKFKWRKND